MLAKKIAYNTIISLVSRILSTIGALLVVGLSARYLGQSGFGNYSTVLAFLYIFSVLADLGLYSITVREISKEGARETEIVSHAFSLRFWAGLLMFCAAPAIAWLMPYSTEVKIGITLATLGSWFLSNTQVLMGVFQKYLKMEKVVYGELAGRIIQLLIVWFVAAKNLGFFSLVLAYSLSSFVNFLIVFWFARKYIYFKVNWNFSKWRKLLEESFPLAISAIFVMIYFKLDTVMLSLMRPASDVGIYGAAYKILESLIFFPAMFVGLIMPFLSKTALTNSQEFKRISQKAFDILMIFALPLAIGGVFLAGPIIKVVAGSQFCSATEIRAVFSSGLCDTGGVLVILLFATAIIFFGSLFSNMIVALGKQKALAKIYATGAAVNFSVNLFLIPRFTYWGAASSTLFTEALVTSLMLFVISRLINYRPGLASFFKILLAAAVMASFLFIFQKQSLLILILGGIAIYFLVYFALDRKIFKESVALIWPQ